VRQADVYGLRTSNLNYPSHPMAVVACPRDTLVRNVFGNSWTNSYVINSGPDWYDPALTSYGTTSNTTADLLSTGPGNGSPWSDNPQWRNRYCVNQRNIAKPSNVFLLVEHNANSLFGTYRNWAPSPWFDSFGGWVYPFHQRQPDKYMADLGYFVPNGRSNYLYCDGRVQTIHALERSTSLPQVWPNYSDTNWSTYYQFTGHVSQLGGWTLNPADD
jgi:prepilin-type processing-associated H-X9-DG protein